MKVCIVACQLTGEANEWWESILEGRRDARTVSTAQQANAPNVENLIGPNLRYSLKTNIFWKLFVNNLGNNLRSYSKEC